MRREHGGERTGGLETSSHAPLSVPPSTLCVSLRERRRATFAAIAAPDTSQARSRRRLSDRNSLGGAAPCLKGTGLGEGQRRSAETCRSAHTAPDCHRLSRPRPNPSDPRSTAPLLPMPNTAAVTMTTSGRRWSGPPTESWDRTGFIIGMSLWQRSFPPIGHWDDRRSEPRRAASKSTQGRSAKSDTSWSACDRSRIVRFERVREMFA